MSLTVGERVRRKPPGARNVLYIDLGGNYAGINICRNFFICTLKICALYYVCNIFQHKKKIRRCRGAIRRLQHKSRQKMGVWRKVIAMEVVKSGWIQEMVGI